MGGRCVCSGGGRRVVIREKIYMKNKNRTNTAIHTLLCVSLAGTVMFCALPGTSRAMLVPTQNPAPYNREADLKQVQTALESKMVRERLRDLGIADKDIDARLAKLTDAQVHQLAKNVNTLSPGGDATGVLVIVVLVLLIVFLIHSL